MRPLLHVPKVSRRRDRLNRTGENLTNSRGFPPYRTIERFTLDDHGAVTISRIEWEIFFLLILSSVGTPANALLRVTIPQCPRRSSLKPLGHSVQRCGAVWCGEASEGRVYVVECGTSIGIGDNDGLPVGPQGLINSRYGRILAPAFPEPLHERRRVLRGRSRGCLLLHRKLVLWGRALEMGQIMSWKKKRDASRDLLRRWILQDKAPGDCALGLGSPN
jgi:hypothetical protein